MEGKRYKKKNLSSIGNIESRRENDTQIGNEVSRALIDHRHTKVMKS